MILSDNGGQQFEPHPEGQAVVVCVDVIDEGLQVTQWGEKLQMRMVYESAEKMDDGRPFLVRTKPFTQSLGPKASLRAFLESWRGRVLTQEEARSFDMEQLVGVPAILQIVHAPNPADPTALPFARIQAIMALPKGMKGIQPTGDYVRVQDRVGTNGAPPTSHATNGHTTNGAKAATPAPRATPAPARTPAKATPAPAPNREWLGSQLTTPDALTIQEAQYITQVLQNTAQQDKDLAELVNRVRAAQTKRATVAPKPVPAAVTGPEGFEDFPGRLNDDDDDLPF